MEKPMKSCVVTTAFGDDWIEKILKLTRPRMEDYCKRTQQDFISIEKPLAHPVQYSKSILGNIMVTKGYDQVTFLDCDVLVARDCDDIAKQAENYEFLAFDEGAFLDRKKGMVDLAQTYGAAIKPKFYFNTGVFVMKGKAIGALSQPPLGLFPNHFAEQTWLNIQLHLWDTQTAELDPAYNCMTSVEEHFGVNRYKDAFVAHYAGQSADLDKLADTIKADDKKLEEEFR